MKKEVDKQQKKIFTKHYNKVSKANSQYTWFKVERALEHPASEITFACMSEYAKPSKKMLFELKKVVNNLTNPDYDFGEAFEQLRCFKDKYYFMF